MRIHKGPLPKGWSRFIPGHNELVNGKLVRSPEYNSYHAMLNRCYNPKATGYEYYGGEGKGVIVKWVGHFLQFLADLGPRAKGLTLNRKNENGHYTKDNCEWAIPSIQSAGTRKRKNASSKFRYVEQPPDQRGRVRACVTHNKKRVHVGTFDTPQEAALAADWYIVRNKLKRKLNFPELFGRKPGALE